MRPRLPLLPHSLRIRRAARTLPWVTRRLGPTHRPSLDLVEIDLTFACNLRCLNCDRSCTQAVDARAMSVDQIAHFLDETRSSGRAWRRVRLLGGEPTLHPDLDRILAMLLDWRDMESPGTLLELVSNGHGERVTQVLARVPAGVKVKDTAKAGRHQAKFEAFNLAPIDDPLFARSDFCNGCWIAQDCGIGLNRFGWYPCAVAGGIDRVVGLGIGLPRLPTSTADFDEALRAACALCGHFAVGRWTDPETREPVHGAPQSRAWMNAYRGFAEGKPDLPLYGSTGSATPSSAKAAARRRQASHHPHARPEGEGP